MCGAEHPHVHRELLTLADGPDRFFLDHSEQFDLHGQGQIGDFVQEQGAAFSGLKQALLIADRASKRAFAVAEKFAFHQFGGNGTAVHRHEHSRGPGTLFMNGPRHQFLAGPRVPGDMHRRLSASHPADHGLQAHHGGRFAKQLARIRGAGFFELQRGAHQFSQIGQIYGFGDEIEGAGLEGANRGFHVTVGGDHRNGRAEILCLDPFHQFQPVAVG